MHLERVISPQDARELTIALGGKWYGRYGTAPCPVCQPERRRDQNALTLEDGSAVWVVLNCKKSQCDFKDILAAAGIRIGEYRRPDLSEIHRRKAEDAAAAIRRADAAKRVWAKSQPIAGTPAEVYLRSRRIVCDLPETLRFHPSCFHGPSQQALPAMVALVSGGDSFSIHRTFLRADGSGKAGLPGGDKMMLGKVSGGAVQLSDGPADRLVIAEGIESGLSLLSGLLDEPMIVGAALSTSGMRSLHLPKGIGQIKIAADGDPEGRKAAQQLAKRAHGLGWKVSILDPGDGRDFNDVLKGVAA